MTLFFLPAEKSKERRGFCRGFRPHERDGGSNGRRCHLLSQIQRQTTDCQDHPEDQKWLQYTLDDRNLLWTMGCGEETGRSQKGSLGRQYQGVGHYLQENFLDKRTKAYEQSGTDVTGAIRRQGGG